MWNQQFITLGIESSCDETSIAVVADGRRILSNVISSQIAIHTKFGGVVPEIASRHHLQNINAVLQQALDEAGISLQDVDLIGVTNGPGLIGAVALMRPSKSVNDLELKSVKKKYKNLKFAAGCSREVIERGAEMLGWELDKLICETILAMRATDAVD